MKRQRRPVNLNLTTLQFPITAITSILHRLSGIINLIIVGIILRMLDVSLSSPDGFLQVQSWIKNIFFKVIMWKLLTILFYHIIAGVRHILMDFGIIADNYHTGRFSAQVVFIFTILISIITGLIIW
ncbi:MAG: succinate dehydrogenase, cytochrome b556 subunit [Candidatus Dasytiphilus stammeri]